MRLPKDDKYYHWTAHSKHKMMRYQISESLVKRIIRSPKRVEEGIAPKTFAVMQSFGVAQDKSKKKSKEIWVMYTYAKSKLQNPNFKIIVSAWRYPGITKPGKSLSIPPDTLGELRKIVDQWMKK
ncbi:MAG: hypothetical protein AAB847_02275 [Patescibacteria group bacterium]